jgi:hypothetical protein
MPSHNGACLEIGWRLELPGLDWGRYSMRFSYTNRAMTVWEWFAILGLVACFGFLLAAGAKRAPIVDKARTLKNDLEEIDRAIREAESAGKSPDDGVWDPEEFRPLVREKYQRIREQGVDPFGHTFAPVPYHGRPIVPPETSRQLAGIIDDSFWSPFLTRLPPSVPVPPVAEPTPPQTEP